MTIAGRTIAITGAGRGVGAALAISLADDGAIPVLLGRKPEALAAVAETIAERTGIRAHAVVCDLGDPESCADAATALLADQPALSGIVHNGATWVSGSMAELSDADIVTAVNGVVVGAMILTRHLLAHLTALPAADILTVVSVSGLANVPLRGASVPFRAAKAAQDGFVQGLAEELRDTAVRVQAIHPGMIRDVLPDDPAWDRPRRPSDPLTDREVADAIVFMLGLPPNASVRSMVIERTTDYLLWPDDKGGGGE